uniref:Centrosomal protein 43 n=1 Tax=Sphenodon punctatus TaxID=8508 RepID=A0A8D0L206_SPHPU
MAAAEEDTELRDLLVQTLESSGVLNKIKAELRAAVFLALEEQEKVENKTPLVNESLKKFLNTKDGRLVASLVAEFLQFFNLDFTLAVFQPESSTLNGLKSRENLARDLGIVEAEETNGPLLLEVVRRCQQKKISANGEVTETSQSDTSLSSGETRSKSSIHFLPNEAKLTSQLNSKDLDTKEKSNPAVGEDDVDGDSFFDDPIPKPESTYGWKSESNKRGGSLASLSDAPPIKSGLSSLTGAPSLKDPDSKNSILKDLRVVNAKFGSLELGKESNCFHILISLFISTSHRSEKSEVSIGEEIEDISVEIDDFNANNHFLLEYPLPICALCFKKTEDLELLHVCNKN